MSFFYSSPLLTKQEKGHSHTVHAACHQLSCKRNIEGGDQELTAIIRQFEFIAPPTPSFTFPRQVDIVVERHSSYTSWTDKIRVHLQACHDQRPVGQPPLLQRPGSYVIHGMENAGQSG